jgi:uncharacterized membrane protein
MREQVPQAANPPLRDMAPIQETAARTLTWGFRVSAAILAVGLIVTLARGDDLSKDATSLTDLIPDLLDGEGSAIVSLAILAMITTPVVTVMMIAAGFFKIGDRQFGRISLIVLGVLAVSIVAALLR